MCVIKKDMKMSVVCERCKKEVDLINDLHVLLGTYQGEEATNETYFHFLCWREHFEDKTRKKAETIVNHTHDVMDGFMDSAKKMINEEIKI